MGKTEDSSIMVIGADSHFCYVLRRYVKKSERKIVFSYSGEDALALAQREMPAAIILEVDQPNGWSILRVLKENPVTCKIPIILCGWLDEEKRGIEAGAQKYLRKPILFEDYFEALKAVHVISDL